MSRLGAELGTLDALLVARGEAETALLLDWESWWALELDSKPSTVVRMLEGLYSFYKPLYEASVPVDLAHPDSDLSSYRLVVAPNLYLVPDDSAENLRQFVAGGGTLLMSFLSGIAAEAHDHIRLGGYPAPFRELLGLQIEDFVPMATGETNRLDTTGGETCDLWADLIHPEGAAILASYTDDFYAGTPAVTRNVYGEGAAYYLGTRPEERFTKSLVERVCDEVRVRPTAEVPPGVDTVRRKTEAASFLFLLNHNQEAVEIRLPNPGRDLLTGKGHDSQLTLDPLGAAILQEKRHKVDV